MQGGPRNFLTGSDHALKASDMVRVYNGLAAGH